MSTIKSTFELATAAFYSDSPEYPVQGMGDEIKVVIENHGTEKNEVNTDKTTVNIDGKLFCLKDIVHIVKEAEKYHKALVAYRS